MITIIQANTSHKKVVMNLLDEFSNVCRKIIWEEPKNGHRDNYDNPVFDDVISSENSAIFLAQKWNDLVGILTIHRIPLIRKAVYEYAEIEEMFVQEKHHWSDAAQMLIDKATQWAKNKSIKSIQLKSHNLLLRAHNFYEKNWFKSYWKVFEKYF